MHKATARKLTPEGRSYPDKLFYKIGEVSRIAGVEPYVLRYWETEFNFLKPRKSKSGQRIYVKKDLEMIFQIKDMLYKDRFTIEGVRKKLADNMIVKPSQDEPQAVAVASAPAAPKASAPSSRNQSTDAKTIERIKGRLRDILKQLE